MGFALQAVGKLTIVGKQNTVEMVINADRLPDGNAKATATQPPLIRSIR